MARKTATTAAATAEDTTTNTTAANAVVAQPANALPAFLNEVDMTGKGVSNDAADKLIPMARVLQPLSPQVLNGNPALIPGALAGDILVKNAPKPLIKGAAGIMFQSCYFSKDVVEWKPRGQGGGGGGGFVKRWDFSLFDLHGATNKAADGFELRRRRHARRVGVDFSLQPRRHAVVIDA